MIAQGDGVADQLHASGLHGMIPEVLLQVGAAHAALDRYDAAAVYLEQGLAMAASQAPPPPEPPRPAPVAPPSAGPAPAPTPTPGIGGPFASPAATTRGGAFATPSAPGLPGAPIVAGAAPPSSTARRAARAANRFDWFEVTLLDVLVRLGRYREALDRIPHLADPTHAAEVRFAVTRANAAILGAQGQFEGAHHLLNTAGGLATRIRSRFRAALVEGDRAILLATQGRLLEAITSADRVLAPLIRPPLGEYQQWANAQGAAVALTVSRAASAGGDHLTAQRLLLLGTTAANHVGGAYLHAQVDLSRGVFWLLERDLDGAEAALVAAGRELGVLGCAPAAAQATFEQGRLAQARGLDRSARPLYERARDEFRRLGQPREVTEISRLLVGLS